MPMLPLLLALIVLPQAAEQVIVPPYVSLGERYDGSSVTIMWHTKNGRPAAVAMQGGGTRPIATSATKVAMPGEPSYFVHRAILTGLPYGSRASYEIDYGSVRYQGSFVCPKGPSQPYTFLAVGDIGRGTPGQKQLACQLVRQNADAVALLGDIAYPHGAASDYRKYFFPIQNSEVASPTKGAPFLRNILSVPVLGNHDNSFRNLTRYPDGLAYYAYWAAPVNGPSLPLKIQGSSAAVDALNKAALGKLSQIGNYSFSYGNSRWVVLDSGSQINWRDAGLRKWLAERLAWARGATWSFLAMHAPPYHSGKTHAGDIGMRAIADLLTKFSVDVLFTGHIHNYQRSFPMKFVNSTFTLDRRFDGKSRTKADGTICIISGGGGAELYDRGQEEKPSSWQPFTAAIKTVHSFTRVDVRGSELILRQIDKEGQTLDQIRLTK
jgi:hypothetical protein